MDLIEVREPQSVLPGITATRVMSIISAAENGNVADLFTLYRDVAAADNHIQNELSKRKSAILGDAINLHPWDRKNADDIKAYEFCEPLIDTQAFADLQNWLLNGVLWPVAVAEKVFRPVANGYRLAEFVQVPHQLLDYTDESLKILSVNQATKQPEYRSGIEPDPNRYIIYRGHKLPIPDQWGGPFRGVLFWWLLRTMSRQWWATFIEKYGQHFMIGKYRDNAGRNVLVKAFALARKLGGIAISDKTSVEIIKAATSESSESHERFIKLCNDEISRSIVGQTLSSTPSPTGELGGGTARFQSEVREDLRRMDAQGLAQTARTQLFTQYLRINGLRGNPPLMSFGSETDSVMRAKVDIVGKLYTAGLEPTDDGVTRLSEETGIALQRRTPGASSFGTPMPFTALPMSATPGAMETQVELQLADAFTGRYAPLREIILNATTAEHCQKQTLQWLASVKTGANIAEIMEQVLAAYAASGVTSKQRGTS